MDELIKMFIKKKKCNTLVLLIVYVGLQTHIQKNLIFLNNLANNHTYRIFVDILDNRSRTYILQISS